ncbi:tandem-type lipoprotein [Staphylococcus hyicus]|uniref:Tandem-type lipoprotein n=1 Tax=Staphylococcus hyicus TaxID=1284 RepID=A0ACD5FJ97_STAHY|nr:tandem-type lipoprotein [Staphylococcus hyicus]MCQ9291542.1 tandem-type lipoprotein [Staphylococcus hyicus]MCQ9300998.1 tandem-type lipoprotein [Staphylococcus hyicus]MCQ9306783.1 tandem-type lipoprotein [Staphylococcus hyicus]MCQ9309578.1 tandem-type lipoprotein [Staphylococcus hyicus]MCQ9311617.1 tandem-type lipoprotein [Staphylococcus hyicus]
MIHIKKLSLCIGLVVLTIMMGGCGFMNNENSTENSNETRSEKKIKQSFNKSLKMYPIKNLEDFYDKEGFRDSEFDKNDKGTWLLNSRMAITRKSDDKLVVKGMVLRINRNTRVSEGEYYIREIGDGSEAEDKEIEYPIKMENNKIIPRKTIKDERVKKEIESFKFFVQFANFKDLNSYGQGHFDYNPNVPSYSAEYQLSNEDENVKQLRKRYDIPTDKGPKLVLKGVGEFTGSSIGYKNLEIVFEQNEDEDIYYGDTVDYQPSGE